MLFTEALMINSNKIEKYDDSHRIVLYESNESGECVPKVTEPEIASDLADSYYEARNDVWVKLRKDLKAGEISPIRLFLEYHNMSIKDVAARAKVSPGTVKKHLTMKGFLNMKLDVLQRYARIFDIPVGDFFNFHYIEESLSIKTDVYSNRLFQDITINSKEG